MYPSSSSPNATDPFDVLCQQLRRTVPKKGSIKLANNAVNALRVALKTHRTSRSHVPNVEVVRLVSLLDQRKGVCRRLESMTFGVVLETLLHAGYSREKERGIILLSASFIDGHSRPSAKSIEERKVKIGTECLKTLMICFTDVSENARIRRWVGILILQILENSERTLEAFELGPEDCKRKLGTMILEERNELLRVTCGQLLTSLIAWDIPAKDLWPVGTDSKFYNGFPISSQTGTNWSKDFQEYVDHLFDTSNSSQSTGGIYFPHVVKFNPSGLTLSDCRINVLIDGDLSLCTHPNGKSVAESFEIPFDLISNVSVEDTQVQGIPQITRDLFDLVLDLRTDTGVSCFRNALPFPVQEIRMTVKDEQLADIIGNDLLTAKSRPKVSQSREAIVIGPILDELFGNESNLSSQGVSVVYGNVDDPSNDQGNLFEFAATGVVDSNNIGRSQQYNQTAHEAGMSGQAGQVAGSHTMKVLNSVPEMIQPIATPSHWQHSNELSDQIPSSGGNPSQPPAPLGIGSLLTGNSRLLEDNVMNVTGQVTIHSPEPPLSIPKSGVISNVGPATRFSVSFLENEIQPSDDPDDLVRSYSPPIEPSKQRQTRKSLGAKKQVKEIRGIVKPAVSKQASRRLKKPKLKPKAIVGSTKKAVGKSVAFPNLEIQQSTMQIHPKSSDLDVNSSPPQKAPRSTRPVPQKAVAIHRSEAPTMSIISEEKPSNEACYNGDTSVERALLKKDFSSRLSLALVGIDDVEHTDIKSPERVKWTFLKEQATDARMEIPDPSPNVRRSPRLRKQREDLLARQSPAKSTPAQPASQPAVPPRRSPRLLMSTRDATLALNSVLAASVPLVDPHLARKTPLVGFDSKGPRNQGRMSANNSSILRPVEIDGTSSSSSTHEDVLSKYDFKRKRYTNNIEELRGVKRQQKYKSGRLTPPTVVGRRNLKHKIPDKDNHEDAVPPSTFRRSYALGSQGSRVDENGSPRESNAGVYQRGKYDYIAKKVLIEAQLAEPDENDEIDDGFIAYGDDDDDEMPTMVEPNLSVQRDIYGFSDIPKPRLLSPLDIMAPISEEVSEKFSPYKPYRKVVSRQHIGVKSNEVTTQKAKLLDPFYDEGDDLEYSKFTQRLQSETRCQTKKPATVSLQCGARKRRAILPEDPEATLVQVEDEDSVADGSLSSEGTSDKSYGYCDPRQQSSPVEDRTPDEQWRMALKPHQKGILDALYQISNDLVRYLISHEDAIEDVVHDYLQGGTKLLDKLEKDHRDDKRRIQREVDKAKRVMSKAYQGSRQEIKQTVHSMQSRPVHDIEKKWLLEQETIERLIEEGRGENK